MSRWKNPCQVEFNGWIEYCDDRCVEYLRGRFPGEAPELLLRRYKMRLLKSYNPTWHNRLVVPIFQGNTIVNYVARSLPGDQPEYSGDKYMACPRYLGAIGPKEGTTFSVTPTQVWSTLVVLVEGVFDAISIGRHAPSESILGSHLHSRQVLALVPNLGGPTSAPKRQVVILLDSDKLDESIKIQRRLQWWGVEAIIATDMLPPGKDPGKLTREEVYAILNHLPNLTRRDV